MNLPDPDRILVVTLPVPPSANDYWRVQPVRLKGGRTVGKPVLTAEAKTYHQLVLIACRNRRLRPFPRAVELMVVVHWYRERAAGDLDNRNKVLLDALQNGAAYVNDSQVGELHAYRFEDPQRPRVEVQVCRRGLLGWERLREFRVIGPGAASEPEPSFHADRSDPRSG